MLITLTLKQRSICIALLGRSGAITAKELAARHGISLRSVRYHLDAIRTALKGTGLRLEAKPNLGVWVEGPPDRRDAVISLLTNSEQPVPLQPAERVDHLLRALLAQDGPLSVDTLAQQFDCSRSTILRDLPETEQRLREYGLRLTRTRGRLQVEGPERSRREALVQLTVQEVEPGQFLANLQAGQASPPESDQPGGDLYRLLAPLIRQTEADLGRRFTEESFASLLVHLAVAIPRLRAGKAMSMPPSRLAELKRLPEWPVAVSLAERIAGATGVTLPEPEVAYLLLYLVGGRAQPIATPTAATEPAPADPQVADLVQRFIRQAGELLRVDLAQDEILRDGLTWHLQGLLRRRELKVKVSNPLMAEIRQGMDRVLGVTQRIAAQLPELGPELSADELGYLTIHLAAALERQGQPPGRRVLIVCSTGLGSAQLLAARLMRLFPNLHVVGLVSALDAGDWEQQADLVITTVALPPLPVPQVRVSPLLTAEEAERVARALRGRAEAADPSEPDYPSLDHLMSLIAAHAGIHDADGLREELAEYLIRQRPPLELVEPLIREVGLLGISIGPRAQQGLAIHMQMALPRLRSGQVVPEPHLERFRQEHRSLFQAVERGLELIGRWHGVSIPDSEVVPILRYIVQAD